MPTDRTATRRDFLKATAAGAAGLALATPELTAAGSPLTGTAKSCIFINLIGGPSHLDTLDPKPNAPSDVRGPFRPIPTRVPGLHLSELFPKLAGVADKFSLIRSMHHDAPPIHEAGLQLLNTGRLFRDGPAWPSVGEVMARLMQPSSKFPLRHMVIPTTRVETGIRIDQGLGHTDSNGITHVWPRVGRHSAISDQFYPNFGKTRFGEDCYWAYTFGGLGDRPITTVNMYTTVFDAPSWDCHADRGSLSTTLNDYRDSVAPTFDAALTGLLGYLEESGRLDSTLVVATGEFGRTPRLNANGGRDHWAGCWTALVAGGGVKGGRVIGASDAIGAEPTDRPVTPQELVATIFHAFGVSPAATIPGPTGEPVAVYPAAPVVELF